MKLKYIIYIYKNYAYVLAVVSHNVSSHLAVQNQDFATHLQSLIDFWVMSY